MNPTEILAEAVDKARNYPGDRLCLTGKEILAFRNHVLEHAASIALADLLSQPELVAAEMRFDGGASEKAALRIAARIRLERVGG